MLQYRKSIPALVLKSFPHIILSHDDLTSFSITIHEILPQKSNFHAKFKLCIKISPNHSGIRIFCKLERNFQHWLTTNKTLGNESCSYLRHKKSRPSVLVLELDMSVLRIVIVIEALG